MKKFKSFFLSILASQSFCMTNAQNSKPKDFLHAPGPFIFLNKVYKLSWSSNPAAGFYKQEYIVSGAPEDKFNSMIMLDVMIGSHNVKQVAELKIAELKRLKQTNPFVQYEVLENKNTGECIIDFLLSADDANGNMSVAERNIYRYKLFNDKPGYTGVLLFGVSIRSYGNDISKFLSGLQGKRNELTTAVSQFNIPEMVIDK